MGSSTQYQYFHPNYYIPALSHLLSHVPSLYDSEIADSQQSRALSPGSKSISWRVDTIPALSSNGTATIPTKAYWDWHPVLAPGHDPLIVALLELK
jgi:hypothetical protein